MVFNTSLFLFYFLPAVLIIYLLLDSRFKNAFLLLTGLFFYAWGAPVFVFWMAGSVIADYFLLRKISVSEGNLKKILFWLSVAMNLGLLLYFKYMNFFIDQFDVMAAWFGKEPSSWTKIVMPVGISFITFQKLAYTFDVSRKTTPRFENILDYSLYIFMFPQLLAGPIVRPGQLMDQIRDRKNQETTNDRLIGFYRFVIGLAKKVLIADTLAGQVNQIFALSSSELSTSLAWIGAVAYTFQIYFDFSGYTDMAIGLARLFGFRLPENFNFPYLSRSITEFWKRWHMTLSFWFRDYVFLRLAYATSRKLKKDRYGRIRADKIIYLVATSVTFLLCGFWHGAAWTFVLWGIYQGIFLIFDRLFLLKFFKKIGIIPSRIITFLTIVIGWVLFRSESLDYFYYYLRRMFTIVSTENDVWLNSKFWTMLFIAILFSFLGGFDKVENWIGKLYDKPGNRTIVGFSIIAILLFILSAATVTSSGFSPFIYFRF